MDIKSKKNQNKLNTTDNTITWLPPHKHITNYLISKTQILHNPQTTFKNICQQLFSVSHVHCSLQNVKTVRFETNANGLLELAVFVASLQHTRYDAFETRVNGYGSWGWLERRGALSDVCVDAFGWWVD